MKLDCPHIIQMPSERIKNMLEVPHTDLVVVATTCKHTACGVEIHSSDGAIVIFKTVQQRADAIVPELDCSAAQLAPVVPYCVYLWSEQRSQGRFGWKETPFTRLDLDSNLVSISAPIATRLAGWLAGWLAWLAGSHDPETAQRRSSAHVGGRADGGCRRTARRAAAWLSRTPFHDCS